MKVYQIMANQTIITRILIMMITQIIVRMKMAKMVTTAARENPEKVSSGVIAPLNANAMARSQATNSARNKSVAIKTMATPVNTRTVRISEFIHHLEAQPDYTTSGREQKN